MRCALTFLLPLLLALGAAPATARAQAPTTPRRAMKLFIDAARQGDVAAAARVLDLSNVAAGERAERGPVLARQLKFVLDRRLWIEWEKLSDDPAGDPADGSATERVGEIAVGGALVAVLLARDAAGAWRIAPGTVAAIPALYAEYGPGLVGELLPDAFFRVRFLEVDAWQWAGLLLLALLAWVLGALLAALLTRAARRLASNTTVTWDERFVETVQRPGRFLVTYGLFGLLDGRLLLAVPAQATADRLLRTLVLATLVWLGLRLASFIARTLEERFTTGVDDAGRVRGVRTQVRVLERVVEVVVTVVGGALVLMQFEAVRVIGTSLLASAGLAGLVIGLAAQRSIATLLAGIQLSLTQPIRIGDTVIVENEWGWIEEITLTYVVVRVWDQRRLVVPITKFLDQSFQNWTKASPEILGTVMLYADYMVPVERVRAEFLRLVKEHPLHDGRAAGVQVTDCSERTVMLRALMSSADAGKNWDLRCDMREKLVAFLQQLEGGRYLPRARVEAPSLAAATAAGPREAA